MALVPSASNQVSVSSLLMLSIKLIYLSPSQSSPRIDYLSALPNELLDDIFEQAYRSSPPSQPLSKRLLPFFEKLLYRKVSLSSIVANSRFRCCIERTPRLGHLIRSLYITKPTPDEEVQEVLYLLPNLLELSIPQCPSLFATTLQSAYSFPYLSRLEAITTSILEDPDETSNLDVLAQFSQLPSLKRMRIEEWNEHEEAVILRSAPTVLHNIISLEVQGAAADMGTVQSLLDTCPSVLHLDLDCQYEFGPDFAQHLPLLPIALLSLHLHCLYTAESTIDAKLPRYTQLTSLRLGDGCYSLFIHATLLQLPLLVHIHLGEGGIEPDGFLSLILGATRLTSLRTSILDFDKGNVGDRMARPSETDLVVNADSDDFDLSVDEWSLPGEECEDGIDRDGVTGVIEAAKENGIKVEGSVFAALETLNSWGTELHNRSILYAFHLNDLAHLIRARSIAAEYGVTLPPLDLDSLDLDRLEIVENDVPEREWFMLSLGNKE